jgi:hypothetical protein
MFRFNCERYSESFKLESSFTIYRMHPNIFSPSSPFFSSRFQIVAGEVGGFIKLKILKGAVWQLCLASENEGEGWGKTKIEEKKTF